MMHTPHITAFTQNVRCYQSTGSILLKDAFSSDYINQLSIKLIFWPRPNVAWKQYQSIRLYRWKIRWLPNYLTNDLIQDNYHVDKWNLKRRTVESKIHQLLVLYYRYCPCSLIFFTIRAYQVRKALKTAVKLVKPPWWLRKPMRPKNHFSLIWVTISVSLSTEL